MGVLLGVQGRAAVVVIPEGKIQVEIIGELDAEDVRGCEADAAKIGQARENQNLRLERVAIELEELIFGAEK